MLPAVWKKNDARARLLIFTFSAIVFAAVVVLGRIPPPVDLGFDVHVFARLNAAINTLVALLLMAGLFTVKSGQYKLHKQLMMTAMLLSVLFLLSYIAHHLFAGETKFGGTGTIRTIYYLILFTHIPLAGLILPFILFSAYRALTGDWLAHKRLVKFTWPIWFYVAITGVIVYFLISPYYQ
jgi:putative membrane protein